MFAKLLAHIRRLYVREALDDFALVITIVIYEILALFVVTFAVTHRRIAWTSVFLTILAWHISITCVNATNALFVIIQKETASSAVNCSAKELAEFVALSNRRRDHAVQILKVAQVVGEIPAVFVNRWLVCSRLGRRWWW